MNGADQIGLRVGKVINSKGVGKFFEVTITESSFSYVRKEELIAQETALDGVYIIRTSVVEETLNAQETVRAYKSLAQVEQAFRSYKTIDLKVRPIYHRLEERVKTHVFLCMLAYYVEWHMRKALSPLLFDVDAQSAASRRVEKVVEDVHSAFSPRVETDLISEVVTHSKKSKKALSKAASKKTEEKFPVHSFRTLMADLATIVKNKIQSNCSDIPLSFEKITQPTPLQQKALDLLSVSLFCTQ